MALEDIVTDKKKLVSIAEIWRNHGSSKNAHDQYIVLSMEVSPKVQTKRP